LSKSTQKKLALYLAAMLFLNCCLLWRTRHLITQGLPDFTIFYTAGQILRQHNGMRLYDDRLQENIQASFSPRGTELRGSLLPYNHPPFEALLFVPLARFSYATAYLLWLAINLFLLSALPFLLRPQLPGLRNLPLFLWMLAGLSFFPVFASLIKGQDSVLLLFLYSLAFAALRRNRQRLAGVCVAFGLFKYNLILPFVVAFIWRKRLLLMFLAAALGLLLTSALITGWTGLVAYPKYVWLAEHNPHFAWNNSDGNTPNLRGTISTLLPIGATAGLPLIVAASLAILWITGRASRKSGPNNPLAFAIALVGCELVSYHAFVHDLSLLYLPMLVALNELVSGRSFRPTVRKTVIICLLIFFCSPVYMVLMLRYGQLQLLTFAILIFFFTLLKGSDSTATAPQPA